VRVEKKARPWPKTIWRDTLPRRYLLRSLLLALLLVVACAPVPIDSPDNSGDVGPSVPAPLFAFLASAAASEVVVVEDPDTGESVRVVAGRAYHAASGRLCRRFDVMSPQSYEGMAEGLACKDASGQWTLSRLVVNPEDLDSPP
jgi:hypothetical protein